MSEPKIHRVPVDVRKSSENPWRGICYVTLSNLFAVFRGQRLIGHFDSLDEAVAFRDSYTVTEEQPNA